MRQAGRSITTIALFVSTAALVACGASQDSTGPSVPGPAAKLAFAVQPPTSVTAGVVIDPAVRVTVQDAQGNAVTDATTNITLAITQGSGAAGAALGGTHTVAAVAGVATFSDLTVDKAGADYTISAAAGSLAGDTSTAFAVTPGSAARLAFTVQPPSTVTSGAAISPAVQVTVQDSQGNALTGSTAGVTLAITGGTGASGAQLRGTLTRAAVNGVATFDDLTLDKVGTDYTLTATAADLTSATSTVVAVAPGAAAQLAFTVQPRNTTAGTPISPAVEVTVLDAQDNTATGSTVSITLAITDGTGASGAQLAGTLTRAAVNGVATFDNLTLDKAGTDYGLTATATGLTSATSSALTITGTLIGKALITTNTTWDLGGSPYVITDTVQVAAAATITIEPGVEVRFGDNALILLAGNVVADGTPSSEIVFTSIPPAPASGAKMFQFLPAADLAVSSFSHVTFEKAATAIEIPQTSTTTLNIANATIAAPIVARGGSGCCSSTAADGAGISVSASVISHTTVKAEYPHPVRITITSSTLNDVAVIADSYADRGINVLNSAIAGGTVTMGCCSAKLHIEGYASGVIPAVGSTVNGTSITENWGAPVDGPLEIINADLTDVEINLPSATGTFAYSSFTYDPAYGTRNQITIGNGSADHCRIVGNGQNTGLVVRGNAGYGTAGDFSITYTRIMQNRVGVSASSGSTGMLAMSHNNLTSNSQYNLEYLRAADVTLSNNYWGTADDPTIASLIYDGNENILYGIVTYTPFLTTPEPLPAPPASR